MDQIERCILEDGDTAITVLSMGCAIKDWKVRDRHVALGYRDDDHYRINPASMGVICGRVANRIENARFTLNNQVYQLPANNGPHHLHGGPGGIGRRNWTMEKDGNRAVRLSLVSEDGDQGYPGRVQFEVTLSLDGAKLTYDMRGVPDCETPINLAQHVYFNLAGTGTVADHRLQVNADSYTPNRPDLIPEGHIAPIAGTPYDFRMSRPLGRAADLDGNVVLASSADPAAELTTPDGMRLRLWTDRPGLQLYTAAALAPSLPSNDGASHAPLAGVCLEAQDLPNAVNVPAFGNILCNPDRPYQQTTSIEIR